jgi:hypothetical protein
MRYTTLTIILLAVVTVVGCTQESIPPEPPGELSARVVVQSNGGGRISGAEVVLRIVPTPQDTTTRMLTRQTDQNGECLFVGANAPGWHRIVLSVTPPSTSGLKAAELSDSAFFAPANAAPEPVMQTYTVVLQP